MLGAAIRHALPGQLDVTTEGGTVNRLNKALLAVLQADDRHRHKRFIPGNFRQLRQFRINRHTGIADVITATPTVGRDYLGNILVTVPPMKALDMNPDATHVSIRAIAVHVQHSFLQASAGASAPVIIGKDQPSGEITLTVPAAKAAVSFVVLEVSSLQEVRGNMYVLQNREYNAADIITVLRGRAPKAKRQRRRGKYSERLPVLPAGPAGFIQRE